MFRFTIRDVLWLTVVVALAVGWWIDRGRLVAEKNEARVWKQSEMDKMLRETQVVMDEALRGWTNR